MSEQVIPRPGIAEQIGEQLSALLDGELAPDQLRFLLRGVEADSDLAQRWSRYQIVSATLKHEYYNVALPQNFADSVLERLAREPGAAIMPASYRGNGALRWLGGGAIAAAVAVVALIVARPAGDNATTGNVVAANNGVSTQQIAQGSISARQPAYSSLPSAQANSGLPLAGFNYNDVVPASYDPLAQSYYSPRGNVLWRGDFTGSAAAYPYLLNVAPAAQRGFSPASVRQVVPQSASAH